MNFDDLGLSPDILRAIREAGYETPTEIQAQAIPHVLMGKDLLGCAQTGTGKTASFTLPMIEILAGGRARARMPRSLILAPTRELAAQVAENFEMYTKYNKLSMALLVGGVSMNDQIKKLDRGVDVLIATPGRLIDLFERGNILLSDIKVLVLDECDRMLDMGFIPDIELIVSRLPKNRQTLMFSATLSKEIRRLAGEFLMMPKEVTVAAASSAATNVIQAVARVAPRDKREALRHLLRTEDVKNAFIFCNRKRDVDVLFKSLKKHGFNCGSLHGDMTQPARTATLEAFKNDEIALVVCTDVAARGLDVKGLSHVFNFDVPTHAEDYVHRIGRTGRAGLTGRAFTLVTREEGKYLESISRLIKTDIAEITLDGYGAKSPDETSAESDYAQEKPARRGRGGRKASGKASGRSKAGDPADTASEGDSGDHGGNADEKQQPSDRDNKARSARGNDSKNKGPTSKNNKGGSRRRGRGPSPADTDVGELPDETVKGFGSNPPAFLQR